MRIGINASFARKPDTGIGQVTLNFLQKLASFSPADFQEKPARRKFSARPDWLEFVLYLEEDLPSGISLPSHFAKKIFLPPWRRDDLVRKIWWERYMLRQLVKKDKCDLFLSLYQCPTVLEIKHLMLVHDIIPELFPEYLDNQRKKLYWRLARQSIRKADHIIAVSHRTEKDLVQHLKISPDKISVCWIDVSDVFKKEVNPEKSARVLKKYNLKPGYIYFGGGLEKRKNVETLLKAYDYLREKNEKMAYVRDFPKLVISGRLLPQLAPLVTNVEKLVKKMNLSLQVKILGFVEQEELPALYKNAVFFVYPSYYEGFGLPVLEALNSGTPVVSSKKSSLPEVASDAAIYFNPHDYQDLAMTMKNILINWDLKKRLAARAKERARQFSWDNFCRKIINIIHEEVYQ